MQKTSRYAMAKMSKAKLIDFAQTMQDSYLAENKAREKAQLESSANFNSAQDLSDKLIEVQRELDEERSSYKELLSRVSAAEQRLSDLSSEIRGYKDRIEIADTMRQQSDEKYEHMLQALSLVISSCKGVAPPQIILAHGTNVTPLSRKHMPDLKPAPDPAPLGSHGR